MSAPATSDKLIRLHISHEMSETLTVMPYLFPRCHANTGTIQGLDWTIASLQCKASPRTYSEDCSQYRMQRPG